MGAKGTPAPRRREGIEHPQMRAIKAIWEGDRAALNAELAARPALARPSNNKTPNQFALAVAAQYHLTGNPEPVGELLNRMGAYGHQATKPNGYGSEAGCPDPHAELWMTPLALLLKETRERGDEELLGGVVQYFGDHLAMCRAFWTPGGVRIAGSRAGAKGGLALRPAWSVDSQFKALMEGETRSPHLPFRPSPSSLSLEILLGSDGMFSAIREAAAKDQAHMMVPVRRWNLQDGGQLSAQVWEIQQNDRLSWIQTDAAGAIVAASRTLADLPADLGEPTLTFGGTS